MEVKYVNSYREDATDSLFYAGYDDPIARYFYKGREWALYTFGDVEIEYMGERHRNLNEICSTDSELMELDRAENEEVFNLIHNNWYELRPLPWYNQQVASNGGSTEGLYDFVSAGLYDDIYYGTDEITEEILDKYIREEKEMVEQWTTIH